MRSFLVGLILVTLGGSAFGQAAGFVQQIGFGKKYRPYGWTPVLINLKSTIGEPAEYQIQIRQEDLDRDRVVFTRDIVLNPTPDGERFWVYFLAQPSGLPDGSASELKKVLNVWLCTKGGKPLLELDITDAITNIDPARQGFNASTGTRLVLMVTDGSSSSSPSTSEFNDALGTNEQVEVVRVSPFDLPENIIGYDAVDAIVWLDADAAQLTTGGSRRLAAITDWVKAGGRLTVSQPTERFKIEPLADLLPVELKNDAGDWLIELRDTPKLEVIRKLSTYRAKGPSAANLLASQSNSWDALERKGGPFKIAFATLRPDAVGEEWMDWKGDGSIVSPWLARRPLGFGSVSWVAQDLGNRVITGPGSSGWPYVWDKVLGLPNKDMRVLAETRSNGNTVPPYAEEAKNLYYANASADLGASLLRGMEHEGRAGGLIFLAGVFFIGYWVIAGPVSYVLLASKKRTELSWTIFAVAAMGATLLTVGVVRLVLRGDAEVHHLSLVRMLPSSRADDGSPISRAIVDSRIGLYIPRDGRQQVTLLNNDPKALSYLTPFSIHPAYQSSATDFPAYLEYEVPVRDNPLTEPISVSIPYRSTLKKLEAHWVGTLPGGIDISTRGGTMEQNRPKLVEANKKAEQIDSKGVKSSVPVGTINGLLTNRTGTDLTNVYFAFNFPATFSDGRDFDVVLYVPSWPDNGVVDLTREYNDAALLIRKNVSDNTGRAQPGGNNKRSIRGRITDEWAEHWWYYGLRSTGMSDQMDDSRSDYLRSFPMLSLYDRIQPQQNPPGASANRNEVLRRAARHWDVSELVGAGQLVILAQGGKPGQTTETPLPFGMEVEGDRITGSGTTFYQFALPLDRSELPPPWTKTDAPEPAVQPDAQPAGAPAVEPEK